jgi:hypothetical protein
MKFRVKMDKITKKKTNALLRLSDELHGNVGMNAIHMHTYMHTYGHAYI